MSSLKISFEEVERTLRGHTFGTLSTIDRKNRSHSVGLIYAISDLGHPLRIYAMTQMKTRKVRNIKANPNARAISIFISCLGVLLLAIAP